MKKSPRLFLRSVRDSNAVVMQTVNGEVYHLSAVRTGKIYHTVILAKTLGHSGSVRVFAHEIWSSVVAMKPAQLQLYIKNIANFFANVNDYDYPVEMVQQYGGQLFHASSPLPASTLH